VKYLSLNPGVEAQVWTINRELTGNLLARVDDEAIRSFSSYPEGLLWCSRLFVRVGSHLQCLYLSREFRCTDGCTRGARIRLGNKE
jgi:hypothetical protein